MGPSHEQPDAAGCRPRRGAREAIAELYGSTRAGFLRTATPGGAAMLGTLVAAPDAAATMSHVGILNFGLRFERLQATFYTQAEEMGTIRRMSSAKQERAKTLGAHERARPDHHAGARAQGGLRPSFDFGAANETDEAFTRTAVAMRDFTVALLTGHHAARPGPRPHRRAARTRHRRGATRGVGPPHRGLHSLPPMRSTSPRACSR